MLQEQASYPVSITGELTDLPSRGWWLLKWLLGIPHYFILFWLWLVFIVVSIIAFVAILITARYPKRLFNFNVGVLRWTWRVSFYSYHALGTDKYPPFSLASDDSYPAVLEVPYPGRLSRWRVPVRYLLVIPHCIVTGFFQGSRWGLGLLPILTIFGAVALLFTGKYPPDIFNIVVGMNRWSYRVTAYVALMTDKYPPFRLWD